MVPHIPRVLIAVLQLLFDADPIYILHFPVSSILLSPSVYHFVLQGRLISPLMPYPLPISNLCHCYLVLDSHLVLRDHYSPSGTLPLSRSLAAKMQSQRETKI